MKITSVSTTVVNAHMRNWVFVKVATDEGLVGWGEASLEWKTRAVASAVADLEPLVIDQDGDHHKPGGRAEGVAAVP